MPKQKFNHSLLKKLRKHQNLTSDTDLANALRVFQPKITKSHICQWVKKKQFPKIDNLHALSQLFNVRLDEWVK